MAPSTKYLVAVATYRRPIELRRLLDSLVLALDQDRERVHVVVIDNDARASARATAAEHPLRPLYEIEPEPGIASARNRGLEFFGEQFAAIVFVDDDEWVHPLWFEELVSYADRTGVGVVQGPVVTVLPSDAPDWVRKGQFFQRRAEATGAKLKSAATNNTLMTRKAWVDANFPIFDSRFSTTGGSDFDFFWGVGKAGAQIAYCAEAVVYEDVPRSRLSWKWIRRRYIRNGIAIMRSHRKHGESVTRFLLVRIAALVVGSLQVLCDVVLGRGPRAAPLESIFKSIGAFAALVGYRIDEYGR
jgi:GT2 family glycosyltransferase